MGPGESGTDGGGDETPMEGGHVIHRVMTYAPPRSAHALVRTPRGQGPTAPPPSESRVTRGRIYPALASTRVELGRSHVFRTESLTPDQHKDATILRTLGVLRHDAERRLPGAGIRRSAASDVALSFSHARAVGPYTTAPPPISRSMIRRESEVNRREENSNPQI